MRKAATAREIPPPLELLCLKALWTLGEASVRQVQEVIGQQRPLAYTTVMTLLDRLARKGTIERHKVGRAFFYAPCLSRENLRRLALRQFLDCYFEGSQEQLLSFVKSQAEPAPSRAPAAQLDAALL